jgi:methionine sulfoxide reductase heme-binding subunit
LNVEQRYRYLYKPVVFAACLVPAVLLGLGTLGVELQSSGSTGAVAGSLAALLGPDPVNKLLHSCGKTALNLLLITLLVTPVRQLTGFTHLVRLRRMLGLFAFCYAALHFTIYIVLDRGMDWHSIVKDITKRPYITIGFTALLILIPLAVTSTNRMMRRLGRRWQKLHRLIYAAAILGVWHYYWQVKRDVRLPLLYAFMLAVLLGYRLVRQWQARRRLTSKSGSATAPGRI